MSKNNQLAEVKVIKLEPITFEQTVDTLKAIVKKYQGLTIVDINDKTGYKIMDEARKELKKICSAIVSKSKDNKRSGRDKLQEYYNANDFLEKTLLDIVLPLKEKFEKRQSEIDEEILKKKHEDERKEEEKLNIRINQLKQYDYEINIGYIKSLSDDDFNVQLETAKSIWVENQNNIKKQRFNDRSEILKAHSLCMDSNDIEELSDKEFNEWIVASIVKNTKNETEAKKTPSHEEKKDTLSSETISKKKVYIKDHDKLKIFADQLMKLELPEVSGEKEKELVKFISGALNTLADTINRQLRDINGK